ncbi:MAG: DUF1761 domain-containing protein [Candidatus Magasanikbacteria bacterium]|nr:DUF1761 domain-containing protein [Candidatus Magasanikbacteria bacterium]
MFYHFEANYLAVFVAVVIQVVLGFLWYGPIFGKMWMGLMGITKEKMEEGKAKGGMGKNYAIMTVSTIVMAYILAMFVYFAGSSTWAEGMKTGFLLWLGFLATTMTGTVLWEGKPWKLYYLNVAYYLVGLCLMGGILAAWH